MHLPRRVDHFSITFYGIFLRGEVVRPFEGVTGGNQSLPKITARDHTRNYSADLDVLVSKSQRDKPKYYQQDVCG